MYDSSEYVKKEKEERKLDGWDGIHLSLQVLAYWFGSITSRMVLYLTKWPVSINVGKDEMLLTDNLHQGFVELCNDGEASMLRIFYLEDGERRLERECIEITGLERAEDCSSLVFRICRLKSGIDCNEHVLIKPERSKDCHAIYYAFRYLQQKSTGDTKLTVQRKSAIEKRTLVKQLPTFRQISVTHQAYDASNLKSKNNEKTISQRVKNRNQKRKLVTSTYISLFSPSKKLTHESQKEVDSILLRPLSEQHPDELLKADDRILEINSIIPKNNNPKKKIDVNDDFLCIHNKQSSPDLSTSFERLLTGIDAVSSQGFLNLGNSCYMNAVLQGLFHIKAFEDLLNVVPESSQGTILSALKALRKNYQKATNAKKRCLLENVFKFLDDERFEITEQEDAQEFLTIILDKIDSELESFENSTSAERNHLFGSVTSLSSIFGFELKHEITCNKCSSKQIMYEKGVFLPIQIVHNLNNDSLSLQMLLGNYLKNEVVEHICPRCNEKYATMSHQFRTLSKCLIIFLKRYDFKQSTSRRKQRKLKDPVKLSMCIRLISYSREHAKLKNCFNISPPINSDISDDQVSFVLETPPNNLPSSSSSNSENKNASKTIQEINDCDDRKFPKKIIQSTKSTVVVYDSDTEEKLNYLTLFCLPQPDFCERSCAELNIRCHSSTVRQEPKPLFWKSVPSDTAPIVADGNCLFRSIALYLSGSEEEHLIVRKSVVKFEKKYSNQLREVSHFSLAEWKEHVKKMTNDGEWATEIELLALAALLDAEIWTFLNDKWLRYRPLYMVGKNGKCRKLPIQKYNDNGKNAIFLINENFHYKPVFDIISNGAISDYHLAAIISHKGISPNNGHYVCDVRNLNRNLWMHFNDSHVEEKTEAEIISECTRDGYIFFYVAGK